MAMTSPRGEWNNSTVFDYGYSTGDFCRLLQRQGINVTYTGDINENFITNSRKRRRRRMTRLLRKSRRHRRPSSSLLQSPRRRT